jgi:hypothetical protein
MVDSGRPHAQLLRLRLGLQRTAFLMLVDMAIAKIRIQRIPDFLLLCHDWVTKRRKADAFRSRGLKRFFDEGAGRQKMPFLEMPI